VAEFLVPGPEYADDLQRAHPGIDIAVFTGDDGAPADLHDVRFFVAPYTFRPATLAITKDMPKLQVLQTLTAGFEHALPFLPDGVLLCNARGVHDASTAELAVALILASLRGIPDFVLGQQEQRWVHADYPALADKTVLIVGYGSIGAAIASRLLPFETTVVRVARTARPDDEVHGVADLPALLRAADVVVLVTPLTPATKGLVNADFLARMRKGALLVNVARGGVVDTDALTAALHAGQVRAALDVTDPEPLPPDHPLWKAPGLLISPHVGGNTSAFAPRARRLVVNQALRFVEGRPLDNVVAGGPRLDTKE